MIEVEVKRSEAGTFVHVLIDGTAWNFGHFDKEAPESVQSRIVAAIDEILEEADNG